MNSPKLLVAFLLLLARGGAVQAAVVHGTIESLDPEVGTLVLRVPPLYEPKTYSLAKRDLPVTNALGRPIKLDDLETRHRVALTVGDQGDVTAIRLDADCIWGTLLEFDPKERAAHVKLGSSRRSFLLTGDAVVLAEGKAVDPGDLKPGQGFKGVVSDDGKRLVQLQVGKGISAASPYGKYLALSGMLVKADHERKRLHIVTLPKEYQPRELEYEPWAEARLIHSAELLRTSAITELQPFCKINCHIEADTNRIVHVTVETPGFIRRRVEKVEHDRRRLTLRVDKSEVTLPVAADVMIRSVQGTLAWDKIGEGTLVNCALSLDGREIVYLYVWAK